MVTEILARLGPHNAVDIDRVRKREPRLSYPPLRLPAFHLFAWRSHIDAAPRAACGRGPGPVNQRAALTHALVSSLSDPDSGPEDDLWV